MNLCDFMLFADYARKCLLVELTQMFLSKQLSDMTLNLWGFNDGNLIPLAS